MCVSLVNFDVQSFKQSKAVYVPFHIILVALVLLGYILVHIVT